MIVNFNIELNGTNFEFLTMNCVKLQLYQVYVSEQGKRYRFHMQLENDGDFHIKDKAACPEHYRSLEPTMSDAIKKLGKIETPSTAITTNQV